MSAGMENIAVEGRVLLSLQKAATMLDVHVRTVQRLVASGKLPRPIKIGGSSKLPVEEVHAFIERQKAARKQERF
jgi:excisionase family DNA binding protein